MVSAVVDSQNQGQSTCEWHVPGSKPYLSTKYRDTMPILRRPPEMSTSPNQPQIRRPSSLLPPTISSTPSSQWLGVPVGCGPECAQRPVAHASASPIPTYAPQKRLATKLLATCTFPVRAHTSGHASRTLRSCAASSDACAHVPTLAAIRSGPPSAASSASAWVCAEVSCATGVFCIVNAAWGICAWMGNRGSNAWSWGIWLACHQTRAC